MDPEPRAVYARPLDERSLFHQFLHGFYATRMSLRGHYREVWEPPTDVYETETEVVIKVCIPGVDPEEIAVECNGEVLTICGVRRGPDPGSVRTYHQMEIRNGYFERRIIVHIPFDADRARARYEGGFLYVLLPRAPESVRRVVSIRLGI
jgi:HSP20 family protein